MFKPLQKMLGKSADQTQRDMFTPLLSDFIDMKHELVLGRVYEGCTGWEQKFPSRPTFGCLVECMEGT